MTTKTINLLQLAVTALTDIDNGWPLTEIAALEGKGLSALISDLQAHITDLEPSESLKTQPNPSSALRYYQCTIDVSVRESVPEGDILKVLDRLINAGLEDARATLEENEGDLSAAQLAVDLNISTPVLRLIGRPTPPNHAVTAIAMEEALRPAGYTITEDPDQPSRWLWRTATEGCEASYDLRAEAIYEAWGHAIDRVRDITKMTLADVDAISFAEQKALLAKTLGLPDPSA